MKKTNYIKVAGRNKDDKYLTPYKMTERLLDLEIFDKDATFLEPCCSKEMAIPKVLMKYGYNNIDMNIYEETKADFRTYSEDKKYDYIISNIPYGHLMMIDMINKAKRIATKKIILLYPINCLNGAKRFERIYGDKEYPLARIYQFVMYASLKDTLRADGRYEAGMIMYGWFVFERGYVGEITLKQINNKTDIFAKRSKEILTDLYEN